MVIGLMHYPDEFQETQLRTDEPEKNKSGKPFFCCESNLLLLKFVLGALP
jgi:hypothetical protein